jgi:hypothetical protein
MTISKKELNKHVNAAEQDLILAIGLLEAAISDAVPTNPFAIKTANELIADALESIQKMRDEKDVILDDAAIFKIEKPCQIFDFEKYRRDPPR